MSKFLVDGKINVPPNELYQLTEPWPFPMWGINVISPINPKTSNIHRFILFAIDYLSKWIEASSYANDITWNVVKFIHRDIIAHYGVPKAIFTNNGSYLNNKLVDEMFKEFEICHLYSSPYCLDLYWGNYFLSGVWYRYDFAHRCQNPFFASVVSS